MSSIEGIKTSDNGQGSQVQEDLVRIKRSLEHSQAQAKLGSWEYDAVGGDLWWSPQIVCVARPRPCDGAAGRGRIPSGRAP